MDQVTLLPRLSKLLLCYLSVKTTYQISLKRTTLIQLKSVLKSCVNSQLTLQPIF